MQKTLPNSPILSKLMKTQQTTLYVDFGRGIVVLWTSPVTVDDFFLFFKIFFSFFLSLSSHSPQELGNLYFSNTETGNPHTSTFWVKGPYTGDWDFRKLKHSHCSGSFYSSTSNLPSNTPPPRVSSSLSIQNTGYLDRFVDLSLG